MFAIALGFMLVAMLAWGQDRRDVSTAALLREMPGFQSGTAPVSGIRIHYVAGGRGEPLFLRALRDFFR